MMQQTILPLTSDELQSISSNSNVSLTSVQLGGLTHEQLAAINVTQVSHLNTISLPPGSEHWETTAINPNPFLVKEHIIQGELVYTELIVEQFKLEDRLVTSDGIKQTLMIDLAKKLMANKMIEFTKTQNNLTGDHIFRARIYAVPDGNVRILRESGKLAK